MNPQTHNLIVKGHKVRTRTARRYIVVDARESDVFQAVDADRKRIWIVPAGGAFKDGGYLTTDRDVASAAAATVPGGKVEMFAAYAEVTKRTDSLDVARRETRKRSSAVVVDTETGEEI